MSHIDTTTGKMADLALVCSRFEGLQHGRDSERSQPEQYHAAYDWIQAAEGDSWLEEFSEWLLQLAVKDSIGLKAGVEKQRPAPEGVDAA